MNLYVSESKVIGNSFNIHLISSSYKKSIEDSKISFFKFCVILRLYNNLISSIIKFKPKFIYFQLSPLGLAFYRDCTFIGIMKLFKKHIVFHMHGKGINEVVSKNRFKKSLYT